MKIRCGFDISYQCVMPTAMAFLLSVRPERERDLLSPQVIDFDPWLPSRTYNDQFGNRVTRILAQAGVTRVKADFVVQDSGALDEVNWNARQLEVQELPDDVLVFLMPSRYCDTEHLSDLAWSLFGQTQKGWPRVQAIVDYAHSRIRFDYQLARNTRTASEGHFEQVGVCRDFAHLAVALCRCMNIPARYATGYLGDIGVPAVPDSMDFSAWFEVYLDGRWYTFDARHNKRRIGRVVMAYGRDAVDVAISTAFGPAQLLNFTVITEEVQETVSSNHSYAARFPSAVLGGSLESAPPGGRDAGDWTAVY
jgi:transglutaminase-like putative cysteine protease